MPTQKSILDFSASPQKRQIFAQRREILRKISPQFHLSISLQPQFRRNRAKLGAKLTENLRKKYFLGNFAKSALSENSSLYFSFVAPPASDPSGRNFTAISRNLAQLCATLRLPNCASSANSPPTGAILPQSAAISRNFAPPNFFLGKLRNRPRPENPSRYFSRLPGCAPASEQPLNPRRTGCAMETK